MKFREQYPDSKELEKRSLDAGISFEGEVSVTRSEFADDCDVNRIVSRYGVPGGDFPTGEMDEADTFQALHVASLDAREAFYRLSPELQAQYRDWRGLLQAAEAGQVTLGSSDPSPLAESPSAGDSEAPSTP